MALHSQDVLGSPACGSTFATLSVFPWIPVLRFWTGSRLPRWWSLSGYQFCVFGRAGVGWMHEVWQKLLATQCLQGVPDGLT